MKKRYFILAAIVLILIGLMHSEAYAWSAVGLSGIQKYNTHKKLTTDAVNALDKNEYPDLNLYRTDIIHGSSNAFLGDTEDIAHDNNTERNDGPYGLIWTKTNDLFKEGNYGSSYYRLGVLIHLVEDMAVPAHVFDIKHLWTYPNPFWTGNMNSLRMSFPQYVLYQIYNKCTNEQVDTNNCFAGDDLEAYAMNNYQSQGVNLSLFDLKEKDPTRFYTKQRDNTIDVVSGDWFANYWHYGNKSEDIDRFGNGYGNSRFASELYWEFYTAQQGGFAINRIQHATQLAAQALAAASKSFPPTVTEQKISNVDPNAAVSTKVIPGKESTISFDIKENRTKKVLVSIKVEENGQPGRVIKGNIPNLGAFTDNIELILPLVPQGTGKFVGAAMPFMDTFYVKWDGKLADGTYFDKEKGNLLIEVIDDDGNSSAVNMDGSQGVYSDGIRLTVPPPAGFSLKPLF